MTVESTPTLERDPPTDAWSAGRVFLVSTVLWLAVSAAVAWQVSALGFFPWASAFWLSLLDFGPWVVATPLVVWLAHRLPIGPGTWRWTVPTHLIVSVALVALMEVSLSSLGRDVPGGPPPPASAKQENAAERPRHEPNRESKVQVLWFRFFVRARMGVPIYWMLVAGAHALAHQRRSIERERRALRAEAHLAEARLAALQAQLNPHFLFNTLNTIAELVYANPPAAEATIVSLSELLRAALAAQQQREVTLAEEMKFVERYGAIQKTRFTDRLEVRCEIAPAALTAAVPTLLLQPLVENAIIHGVAPRSAPGQVFIRARVVAERLELEVADTGNGAPGRGDAVGGELRFREGIGLTNTRARLAALYGELHRLTLSRASEGGVAVKIELPFRRVAPT